MPMTDLMDQRILNWGFANTTFVVPPTMHIALYTAAPTKAGGGTEVSGAGYVRLTTALADWNVSGPTFQVQNTGVLQFATPTGSWGTAVSYGIFDAASGGNLLWFGALSSALAIGTDDPVVFNIGQIVISGVA